MMSIESVLNIAFMRVKDVQDVVSIVLTGSGEYHNLKESRERPQEGDAVGSDFKFALGLLKVDKSLI